MASVTVVGPGRMGLALGGALLDTGAVPNLTVYGRRPEPPSHPMFIEGRARYVFGVEPLAPDTVALFLAVPDAVVPEMAFTMAGQGDAPEGAAAFHLSGVVPTDVLAPLYQRGYAVGSFHPLQTVAHPLSGGRRIPGSYIAVVGSPEATAVARRLAAAMGSQVISVPASRRPLFHAATVLAASFLPPLLDLAARLMERAGASGDEALAALLPLVRGTLASIEEGGLQASVRGPIVEGDVETIALHLRALDPEDRRLYAALGAELLRLAGPTVAEETRHAIFEQLERAGR